MWRAAALAGVVLLAAGWLDRPQRTDRIAEGEAPPPALAPTPEQRAAALALVAQRSATVRRLLDAPAAEPGALQSATDALGVAMRHPALDPHARTGASLLWHDAHRRLDRGRRREAAPRRGLPIDVATREEGSR